MQVRTGNTARRAGKSEDLAIVKRVAELHIDPRKMRVQRVDSQAVVQDHGVSREEQILRQDDASPICRVDRGASRRAKVRACMRRARLAVKDAAMTEIRTCAAGNRNGERLIEKHLVC